MRRGQVLTGLCRDRWVVPVAYEVDGADCAGAAERVRFLSHIYRLLKLTFYDNSLDGILSSLSGVLGEFFQIRDDYKNLTEEVRPPDNSTILRRRPVINPLTRSTPAKRASAKTSTKANSLSH
jgi:hypothetical protein